MDRIMFPWLGVLTSLCLCAFTFLLLLDLRSAFHKRATWIPGKALVLGALTIQFLSFVAGTNLSFLQDSIKDDSPDDLYPGKNHYANQLTIAVCEIKICVFLVYFMPGMVSTRSTDHLAAIVVFIIGVYLPLKDFISPSDNQGSSFSLFLLLWPNFIYTIFLMFFLGSALIAAITVRRILQQRISATLSTDNDEEIQLYSRDTDEPWNNFEDELFKLWMVARISQPDYVIARSILTSAAWLLLSYCVPSLTYAIALALSWNETEKPMQPLLFSLSVYTVVEWIVICCRWYSSLLIRKRRICFEDFWTRALREIINKYDLQKWRPGSRRYSPEISLPRIAALLRLHKLLYLVWVLQILLVSVSKLSWVLSDFVCGKILRQCRKCAWSLRERVFKPTVARYRYESYASVIERICMPGENPSDLWEANKRAINRVAHLFKKGREEGSITNCLFTRPFSMEWVDRGFQLLDKLRNTVLPEIVENLPNSENRCWKMTVVSLTLFVIELNKRVKSNRVTNAFHACHKAWDFLSFLDEIDSRLSSDSFINSGAADMELSGLRHLYGSLPSIWLEESARKITIEEAKNLCKCPGQLKEINSIVGKIQGRADHYAHSKDWMRIAPRYYLYKLCKVMEEDLGIENMEDLEEQAEADTAEDLISWAESSLRNVIAAGVCTVPDMLAKHCRKCVQGFDEDKIWEAIYLAGKARGMMESWGLELKRSSNEWTFQLKGRTQA